MKNTKKIAGILLILILIRLSVFMISCEKETIDINDNTNNDTIIIDTINDDINIDENLYKYIQIQGCNYLHEPQYILNIKKVIYGPIYWVLDTLDYIEEGGSTYLETWAFYDSVNNNYYEIQPIEYSTTYLEYTITNDEAFILEIDNLNDIYIEAISVSYPMFIDYYITYEYLDNQYDYDNCINTKIFIDNECIYDRIGENGYGWSYNEMIEYYDILQIESFSFRKK
ncbi:hypothetical protein M0Q97_11310 [Candidatus Dojkabacteria bacterium]|jgi:hypothetical protein|nr:hypothetical protein [Candidatus Dojkabacteria bacterium]